MANEVDIYESWLLKNYRTAFEKLLEDHSSGQNIYWATDNYMDRGEGFGFFDPIEIDKIKGDEIIRPRVRKSQDEQTQRVRDKAEVFTPAWICNAQNNLVDDAWFGCEGVFNRGIEKEEPFEWIDRGEPIDFGFVDGKPSKLFEDYVKDRRLEITCGEAPYLVSRYDAVSGQPIPVRNRIGMLDRKLHVISENIHNPEKWLDWAREAVKSIYGFEWQGDSLLLAREAVLLDVIDHFKEKFLDEPGKQMKKGAFTSRLNNLAYFISCNLWQMDGLNYVLPGTADTPYQVDSLFVVGIDEARGHARDILEELRAGKKPNDRGGIPAIVYDWWYDKGKGETQKQFFASLVKQNK